MSRYDVVIVGGGMSGASLAYHLNALGLKTLVLHKGESQTDKSLANFHLDHGDFITRVNNAYGPSVARDLWSYSESGYEYLKSFLQQVGIPFEEGSIRYLAANPLEIKELDQVKALMSDVLAHKTIVESSYLNCKQLSIEKASLCLPDLEALVSILLKGVEVRRSKVLKILEEHSVVKIETEEGTIEGEIAIGAAHLGMVGLFDIPPESLVPYQDQWHLVSCHVPQELSHPGDGIFWNYKYFHCLIEGPGLVRVSGGRFLRKNAGIGEGKAEVLENVKAKILDELQGKGFKNPYVLASHAMTGLRPCDEIPLIGPLFSGHKQLMSSGYMGQGLVLGFYSGKCLGQLIANGVSSQLPRILWPERLRSLPKD